MPDSTHEKAQAVATATINANPQLANAPERAVIQQTFANDLDRLAREGRVDLDRLVGDRTQTRDDLSRGRV